MLDKETIVLKFGGASVATPEHFADIAEIVLNEDCTARVVVVVSAMGDTTDELLTLARRVHPSPPLREQDMLVSVGERISASLLAMALNLKNKEAISFTGSQSGIITSSAHAKAQILDVRPQRILNTLDNGKVAIVAGFQGVSKDGEVTTLDRGGSDTSAVALAVALGASKVKFYKDVQGLYSDDPKKNPGACFYPFLSFEEAIEIVERGAEVLHPRCIKLALRNGLPLHVLSFYDPNLLRHSGTLIGPPQRIRGMPCRFEGDCWTPDL